MSGKSSTILSEHCVKTAERITKQGLRVVYCKLCFINKVREEHLQIINLINTRGAQSVIKPVNKIRDFYIYTADLPLFIDSFPASLRHPLCINFILLILCIQRCIDYSSIFIFTLFMPFQLRALSLSLSVRRR